MDRRTQILDAAEALGEAGGPTAVSVRAVAARAEIGASTLRHYFPSQAELVDAVWRRRVGRLVDESVTDLDLADASTPAADRLTRCLLQFLPGDDGQLQLLEQWLVAYAADVQAASGQARHSLLAAASHHSRERVTGWLEVLAEQGVGLRCDLPDAATVLLAAVNGLALELLTPGTQVRLPDARRALRQVVAAAVLAERRR